MDGYNVSAPDSTNLSLEGVEINQIPVLKRENSFMGINVKQLEANMATMKTFKMLITDSDSTKPYANLEYKLFAPPTMALKEIVDPGYPARLLTRDKQFINNLSSELMF